MIDAGVAYAAALAALHAACFPAAQSWPQAAFAAQLAHPGVFARLVPEAGFVLARVAADEAEILTLAVLPAGRRRGVAAALLASAMEEAAARGAARLFLEVSAANGAARALYAAHGFAEAGRRPAYYPDGSDALLLARALTPCG